MCFAENRKKPAPPLDPQVTPKANTECGDPINNCPLGEGMVRVLSYYRDFSDVGVGHQLKITTSDGTTHDIGEIRLPVGEDVAREYGPYPVGETVITLTPIVNHDKQDDTGVQGPDWIRTVIISENTIVEAHFKFVEVDTWDNRYTTDRINQLHPDHRNRFMTFINKVEEDLEFEFRVADGMRTPEEQDRLYCNSRATHQYCINLGYTSGDGAWRSDAKKWESYHNYGLAVDIYRFVGQTLVNPDQDVADIGTAFGLSWGGTWNTPDMPHFEVPGLTTSELNQRRQNGQTFVQDGLTYVNL